MSALSEQSTNQKMGRTQNGIWFNSKWKLFDYSNLWFSSYFLFKYFSLISQIALHYMKLLLMEIKEKIPYKHTLKLLLQLLILITKGFRGMALDTNLRMLQYSFLNNIYSCIICFRFKKVNSSPCSYCNEEKETPIHLFNSCLKTRQLWNKLRQYLSLF